ncbi:alkaline phosphatase [Aeromicrobium endophyticum]|uniref:Alkaline phosphatase n=1 Tax=Aeromicrobium endophyticum TaxID=2292704 RepID=A0A371P1S5_9ACTN|nr:alkaline phosphatase [Aeromicrobium endophyticum]REK69899.1 alkaline phosphatase [Aeromicrobium endophyticum]
MVRRTTMVAAAGALALGGLAIGSAVQAVSPGFTDDRSANLSSAINSEKPRNVILLIGDGTDDSIITAARNYELGAKGRFALDELPFTGAMTTFGLKTGPNPDDYPINYVSDSAPTASGWSTGKKTVDSRISQGPSASDTTPGTDYDTVLEKYKLQGKRTGNVSTAEITDATPAAAGAHINLRACQGPADMANCTAAKKSNNGKGSIAEQLVDNKIDVLLGGGKQRYTQATDAGPTVLDYAKSDKLKYNVVENKDALDSVKTLDNGPILGLFTSGNMTPRYQPLVATAAGAGGPDTTCQTANRGTQPSLADMTDKAIKLLDNDKGFFLQVESAMIDKQEHASDICGAIGDVVELDSALKVAQAYQAKHPDTLIIVTGDHAHSTQIVGNGAGTTEGATGATGGKATTTLKTFDGDPMTVAYSTAPPNAPGASTSQSHTGSQIRVAASGPQAANVTGTIDQTDLFATMLGRTPSKVATPATPPTPAAPSARPALAVVADKKISAKALKTKGLRVSTSASAATSVKITLLKGSKVLATRNLGSAGGTAYLRARGSVKGAVKVVVTATGPGGSTSKTRSSAVTR